MRVNYRMVKTLLKHYVKQWIIINYGLLSNCTSTHKYIFQWIFFSWWLVHLFHSLLPPPSLPEFFFLIAFDMNRWAKKDISYYWSIGKYTTLIGRKKRMSQSNMDEQYKKMAHIERRREMIIQWNKYWWGFKLFTIWSRCSLSLCINRSFNSIHSFRLEKLEDKVVLYWKVTVVTVFKYMYIHCCTPKHTYSLSSLSHLWNFKQHENLIIKFDWYPKKTVWSS